MSETKKELAAVRRRRMMDKEDFMFPDPRSFEQTTYREYAKYLYGLIAGWQVDGVPDHKIVEIVARHLCAVRSAVDWQPMTYLHELNIEYGGSDEGTPSSRE